MEEEQNQNDMSKKNENDDAVLDADIESKKDEKISKEKPLDEIVLELEDKLARSFAEMENQRRRFEKEKEEAYRIIVDFYKKEGQSAEDSTKPGAATKIYEKLIRMRLEEEEKIEIIKSIGNYKWSS